MFFHIFIFIPAESEGRLSACDKMGFMQIENIDSHPAIKTVTKETPVYDSSRRGILALEELRETLRYQDLILQLVRRDIVARYKRSVLGVAWTMLNPLAMMVVMTIVFSQLFHSVPGYPAYILSGLLVWTFFNQTTSAIINSLVWGGAFFQRIYVPRSAFAISAMGTGIVNLLLSLIPLLGVMLLVKIPIRPSIIFVPIPILLLACFALGVGLLVSSMAIFFPDVVEMYQVFLLIWFYITPIIYPIKIIPERLLPLLKFNIFLPLLNLFRLIVYEGKIPTLTDLLPPFLIAIVMLVLGWWIFAQKSDEFVYRT